MTVVRPKTCESAFMLLKQLPVSASDKSPSGRSLDGPMLGTTDDPKLVQMVTALLKDDGPRLHGMSIDEYVDRCRTLWHDCDTDEAFCFKLLIDKRVYAEQAKHRRAGAEFSLLEHAEHVGDDAHLGEIYCVAIALMSPDGSFVGASKDYKPPRKFRGNRAVLGAGEYNPAVSRTETDKPTARTCLVAMFDVLGFSNTAASLGLLDLYAKYSRLIAEAVNPIRDGTSAMTWTATGPSTFSPTLIHVPIRTCHFSDTILLWVDAVVDFVNPFFDCCSQLVARSLDAQIPLRGAVSIGDAVMHAKTNTFLGRSIIEAHKLEKCQDWIGVGLCASFQTYANRLRIDPIRVRPWEAPLKVPDANRETYSGLSLDWPRRYRENRKASAVRALLDLRSSSFAKYYDNAIRFVEESDRSPKWYEEPV